ncbi:MAG TPA: hypothetical protein EYO84_06880 [Planctomycetes bacterium]|nr:hypothetical protein [Planctomycetota bacterium]
MSTRERASFLRQLGFTKADWGLTRAGYTYEHPDVGIRVTILKGGGFGANFVIQRGCVDFTSGFMGVGNLADGVRALLQHLYEQGLDVPDPNRGDYGEPQFMEDLFHKLVIVNLNYEKADKQSA